MFLSIHLLMNSVQMILPRLLNRWNPNKAHGYDKKSIPVTNLRTFPIAKPLSTLFRNCFEIECFPKEWKKTNIVPIHKKMIKN